MGGSLTKGLFAGAHGGSRALAEYILNQRSQRNALAAEGRQEARTIATETRKQRAGAPLQQAQVDYYDARAKAAGKPPEPVGSWKYNKDLNQWYNDKTLEVKTPTDELGNIIAPEEKPEKVENKTGAPNYGNIVKNRIDKTDKAMEEWDKNLGLFKEKYKGMEAGEELPGGGKLEHAAGGAFINSGDAANTKAIIEEFIGLGERPTPYKSNPALADSAEMAKTDPAVLDALLSWTPEAEAKGQKADPEILKAKQALESGQISQADYDEFVRLRGQ